MSTDERIVALEKHLHTLQATQVDLNSQLKEARLEQWQGRIDNLELQVHLAAADGSDRLTQMSEKLRSAWARTRVEVEDASSTASSAGETLRAGLQSAYTDVREALLETRSKITRS
ncbi:hypothetical protein [Aeromicrobium sp.]|uniref:hypothetical protein n=1 Tax=Aeromicrobium sp. TaxID=1871063 RepID=UPI0019BF7899|nr:hypothetical protein [Aeromicrobium sp.]MBC7633368.1 hypothetical protein [Aeromicrobium sp.]